LRRVRRWLDSDGVFVGSVPNARYHRALADLLAGRWAYRVCGASCRPQVRFFTRRETEKLFYRAGFEIPLVSPLRGPDLERWQREGAPTSVQIGRLTISGLPSEDVQDFYAAKYLVRAVPAASRNPGVTSVIVVTHNGLACTRECLGAVRRFTDEPYEFVVVDNGSTDGTVAYLQECADVTLIVNRENRGYPAAINQAIRVAKGQQLLILHNDTVVTTGWLRKLLHTLDVDRQIGLVGPCTNCATTRQQISTSYAEDLLGLDDFAWERGKTNRATEEVPHLDSFCLLVRRDVMDRIGGFDEAFSPGGGEDEDYCLRAAGIGYRSAIVSNAFVHHLGGRTFAECRLDRAALLRRHQQLLRTKLGSDVSNPSAETPTMLAVGMT
jgi:GT2 family glycosyltransferase